jgi:putative SOS response-associated peptidase YedK
MCGRFTLASDIDKFLEQIGLAIPEQLAHPRRYNIAPSQPVLGIVADPHPRVEVMEWGYLPIWAKPDTKQVINARIESIAEGKPYYRGAFKSARCAILADGFYEWKKDDGGKRPYRIGLRDGGVFTMAGLWSRVHTGDGSERATCAIVTIPPNELMKGIHDRMPAILQPEDLTIWLDPKARERDLFAAVEPYPASAMRAYEVSLAVNSPAHDLPDCIRPIDDEN